jgi:hypothetical protein
MTAYKIKFYIVSILTFFAFLFSQEINDLRAEESLVDSNKQVNCSLTAQCFYKTSSGEVKIGAGSSVFLLKATDTAKSSITNAVHADSLNAISYCPDLVGQSIADAIGSVIFSNISPGNYFLVSEVRWIKSGMFVNTKLGGIVIGTAVVLQNSVNRASVTN